MYSSIFTDVFLIILILAIISGLITGLTEYFIKRSFLKFMILLSELILCFYFMTLPVYIVTFSFVYYNKHKEELSSI